MNLAKKYKQLFEGKTKSNDSILIKEDVSTMKLKSNIAQTWKDERNVEEDLVAWFDGAVSAGGTDLGDDIIHATEAALERMRKINDAYLR